MADFIDHVGQAKHNLSCAKKFLDDNRCRDWAITAAFYSALHFVEAGFTITNIIHTDLNRPQNESPHTFRMREIKNEFGKKCWFSYRKLFDASYNVRYLALWNSKTGEALSYYSQNDVKSFIENELGVIRREIQTISGLDLS